MKVSVYRYNPETDAAPRMQDYYGRAAGRQGPDGPRRDGTAEGAGSVADVSAFVPRRRVRLRRRQHERQKRTRVHHAGFGGREERQAGAAAVAGLAGDSRSRHRHEPVLPAVRKDPSVPDQRSAGAGAGATAVAGGSREARRPVRVHSVRVLFDGVSVVLVEPRQVHRSGRVCCRRIGSSPTAAIPRRPNGSRISMIRSACSVVAAS